MKELTLPKILVAEIHSQANLKSSYQVAKVFIVPAQEGYPPKIGLEVKLIPISSDMKIDEEKFKPKSIFFVNSEIMALDRLIEALAKARWMFFLQNNAVEMDMIRDMINNYMASIRNEIEAGVKESGKNENRRRWKIFQRK
jgi:hypothetical protein